LSEIIQENELIPLSKLLKQYPEANFLTRILGSNEKLKDQVPQHKKSNKKFSS